MHYPFSKKYQSLHETENDQEVLRHNSYFMKIWPNHEICTLKSRDLYININSLSKFDTRKRVKIFISVYINGILDIIMRYLEKVLKHDLMVILLTPLVII